MAGNGYDSSEDRVLQAYWETIRYKQPLSREREYELARLIREGNQAARGELVEANLRFVVDVAKTYKNRGLSLSELISAGNLGLMEAVSRFDETRGYKFISYAVWWIKQSILKTLADNTRAVKNPTNALTELRKISRSQRTLQQTLDRDPTPEEIAEISDLELRLVNERLAQYQPITSLNRPYEEGDDETLIDSMISPAASPDKDYETAKLREELRNALNLLDDRESKIIRLHYGLDGEKPLTLKKIGEIFGLTGVRIRQLKERGLGKLRTRNGRLKDYHT